MKILTFFRNFVNISLKYDWYIDQSKKYYLILKIAI